MSTFAATRYMRSDREGSEQLLEIAGNARNDMMLDVHRRREAGELPERFIDLHFSDLMQDPVKALEAVYRQSGKTFSKDYQHAIKDYLTHKPKGKHGKHKYLPEDWGMDTETLKQQAQDYMQAYRVQEES